MNFERKHGTASPITFVLVQAGSRDFLSGHTFEAGDVQISLDGGALANTTNVPVSLGAGLYRLILTAAELTAAQIAIAIVDQTGPKAYEDNAILIETYGNAAAEHAVDRDDAVRAGMTALPAAAAGANGGLPTVNASNQVAGVASAANITSDGQAISTTAGKVDHVTLCDTNADQRGTDNASTHNASDVWSVTTRRLSDATNITSDGSAIAVTAGVVDSVTAVGITIDVQNTVSADIKAISGNNLPAESGPGQHAAGFAYYYDVATPAKTMNDVGGSGGGGTDWTATERSQIRHRLGVDGATDVPTASPDLARPADIVTGGAIATTGGAVDNVGTCAVNSDMRGTDNASTHAAVDVFDYLRTNAMPESYAGDGVEPTLFQAIYACHQKLFAVRYQGLKSDVFGLDNATVVIQGDLDDQADPKEDRRAAA